MVSLNDALVARDQAREDAGLPPTLEEEVASIALYNQPLGRPSGEPLPDRGMPRCDHCQVITQGVDAHPDLVSSEAHNAAKDRARRAASTP